MISPIEQFYSASFRGVPFLVPKESANRGQKLALHEYPNSDRRFAEPMGKIPPIINLTCIVHGERFFQDRADLEFALDIPGLGRLEHPVYGLIEVQPGPFTVESSQSRSGEFIFTTIFYSSDTVVTPKALRSNAQTASNRAEEVSQAIADTLEEKYAEPTDSNFLDDMVGAMDDALNAIQKAINDVVGPIQSAIATVNSTINNFRNKLRRIMQTGTGLKNALLNLENNIKQLSDDPATLSAAWDNLFEYDKNIDTGEVNAPGPTNTVRRSQIESNKAVLSESMRLIGLSGSYESSAYTEFANLDVLNETNKKLNDAFNEFFELNVEFDNIESLANDPDLRAKMQQLRVDANIAINNQLVNVWKVVEVEPGLTSMSLMSYRFYRDIENVQTITDLNPDINQANFNIKVKATSK